MRTREALKRMHPLLHKIKVGERGECWPWQSYTDQDGYGLHLDLPRKKSDGRFTSYRAHRTIFRLVFGDFSEPVVRHSCDNPPCCNPFHLLPGAHRDNSEDKVSRGRSLKGKKHPLFGKKQLPHVGAAVAESNRRRKQPTDPSTGRFIST